MSFRRKLATAVLALSIAIGGSQALANQELFTELEEAAQSVRQLELLEPVDVEVVTREEYREAQLETIEDEANVEGSEDWNTLLVFLDFIDDDQDIYEIYSGFLGDQVLGSYAPETEELIVVSNDPEDWNITNRITYVHEVVHALQDQHFDLLWVFGDPETLTDDRYYATRSLAEGDAGVAESMFILENNLLSQYLEEVENQDLPATDDIPFFLMESQMFFYEEGGMFVLDAWQSGGWDAVNAIWANPPSTSEQILHPEKYFDGEGAIPVAIADPQPVFGDDWRIIEDNAWGELGTRIFLENGGSSTSEAVSAAEGWGGDGVYVVTNDEESAMVWTTAWDSEDDAVEFAGILESTEVSRLGVESVSVDGGTTQLTGNGWFGEIQREGDVVTYYIAESQESLELMMESQVNAEVQPVGTPAQDATPVATVIFWIRES